MSDDRLVNVCVRPSTRDRLRDISTRYAASLGLAKVDMYVVVEKALDALEAQIKAKK